MADRLTLAHALEEGGIARGAAEDIATAIYDAIHENVATKADIAGVRSDLTIIRSELKADIAGVRAEMREMEQRIVIRLGSMIVIAIGVLLGALHYWPPHAS